MNPRTPKRAYESSDIPLMFQSLHEIEWDEVLQRFEEWCVVDMELAKRTVESHLWRMKRFRDWYSKPLSEVNTEVLRAYLKSIGHMKPLKANTIKAFRRFFRDFLGCGELVASFHLPPVREREIRIPKSEEMATFYYALKTEEEKLIFLFFVYTGLRRNEVWELEREDVDLNERVVRPKPHEGRTKRVFVTFIPNDLADKLKKYQATREDKKSRFFAISEYRFEKMWEEAYRKTGIHITPQVLREWFCQKMGELGVPDRFIDAFCGRIPRSVLARHYSDYSPERLKAIYDKAGLRVLS